MSTTALTTFAALIAVAMLVVVHEFGHFLAAKLFGVHVRVFSVGFGSRLFGFTWRGTDYRVSSIPVGGYVRWAGGIRSPRGEGRRTTITPSPTHSSSPRSPPGSA